MRKILIIAALLTQPVLGQDIHFTQFENNPVYLNPALAGVMTGGLRAAAQYKTQWTVVGASYNTPSLSADMPLFKGNGAYLGVGLNFLRDKAGDSDFGLTHVGISVSGILPVGKESNVSLGIQSAFVQRSMSSESLMWDSQFDGTGYNASLPGENLSAPSFYYFDWNAGLNVHLAQGASTISSNDKMKLDAGFVYKHLTQPEFDFKGSGDQLPSNMTAYLIGHYDIPGTRYYVLPLALASFQGGQREILAGGYFGYELVEDSKATGFVRRNAIAFGAVYRFKDAIAPGMRYEFGDFAVTVSYDINLSTLSQYTSGRGGLEVSIQYQDYLNLLRGGSTHKALF